MQLRKWIQENRQKQPDRVMTPIKHRWQSDRATWGARVPPTPPLAKRRRSTSVVSSFSLATREESLVLDDDLLSEYSYSYSSVAHVAVMSRAHRKEVLTGLKDLRSHDQALHTCLTAQPLHVATLRLLLTNHPDCWSQSQDFVVVDVGKNGQDWTVESMAKILSKAGTDLIVIAVDYEGSDDSQTHGELVDHVVSHCYVSGGRSKQCTA